jgi:hypothetical protein
MKTHILTIEHKGEKHTVHQYFHRSWRVWVSYKVDGAGNQIADCEYDVDKDRSALSACTKN